MRPRRGVRSEIALNEPFRHRGKTLSLTDDVCSVTYARFHAAELLARINETRHPIILTRHGQPVGVLQDPASYRRMRNALNMLKVVQQGDEQVRAGRTLPQPKVFAEVKSRLKRRGARFQSS